MSDVKKKHIFRGSIIAIVFLSVCFLSSIYISNKQIDTIPYKDLDELILDESNLYVLFKKEDCEECKKFIPEFEEYVKTYKTKIVYVDTGNMTEKEKLDCKEKFNLEYVPTILYFSDHKLDDSLVGRVNTSELDSFMKDKRK